MSSTQQSTAASVKTVAALVTMGGAPKPNAYGEFAKDTIQKLKSSNEYEKNELQKLNAQFKIYLDDVKRLEEANRQLIDQVEQAKQIYVPKEMDKSSLDKALEDLRRKLEEISLGCVQHQVNIEENENQIQNYGDKIKFYQNENELQRQKLNQLNAILDELRNQKDYINRASQLADDDVRREKEKLDKADKDLASLLKTLKDSRTRNKKTEFEIQTLLDELSFRKAVFGEEIAELTKQHQVLSPVDLTNFYKNELLNAVRQIRNDFHNLNEQQLKDYKDQKERELNAVVSQIEYERMQADLARERLNASQDLDLQNSKELKAGLDSDKDDAKRLQQQNAELVRRLGELESKLQDVKMRNGNKLDDLNSEIEKLKQLNSSYAGDLDYWDRVTRSKLETEIQTYRSILNYQTKILQETKDSMKLTPSKPVTTAPPTNQNLTPEERKRNENIAILRQVFDYFDSDKTGSINSREMDRILQRLDIKLSEQAYNELIKEFDRDGSRTIEFPEFCRIMLPVFTGKFEDEELWYAFKKFDLDNSGYITAAELRKILAQIGQNFSEKEISDMISTVDADSDGRLSFKEFSRLMKSTQR